MTSTTLFPYNNGDVLVHKDYGVLNGEFHGLTKAFNVSKVNLKVICSHFVVSCCQNVNIIVVVQLLFYLLGCSYPYPNAETNDGCECLNASLASVAYVAYVAFAAFAAFVASTLLMVSDDIRLVSADCRYKVYEKATWRTSMQSERDLTDTNWASICTEEVQQ